MSLVLHYPLTNDVNDISGNNNNGTNNGATLITTGKIGKCYSFNGTTQYIQTPWGSGVNPSTQPVTVAMWVRTNSPSSNLMFFSTSQIPDSNARFYFGTYNTRWAMGIEGSSWGVTSSTVVDTGWTHIVVTLDGTTAKMYINGVYSSYSKSYSSFTFNANAKIGTHDSNFYWNGSVNDVRVYEKLLSDAEIYKLSQAKILHYGFNNVFGESTPASTTVEDLSGYGNNYGIPSSSALVWNDDGARGKCLQFINDASNNSYIRTTGFQTPYDITMLVWFKGTSVGYGNYHIPLSINNTDFEIAIDSGGDLRTGYKISGTRRIVDTNASLMDGNWHLIGSTYDGEYIRSYIDGVQVNNAQYVGTLQRSTYTIGIGKFSSSDTYGTVGYEDEPMIFATALSDEDIKQIYENRAEVDDLGNFYTNQFIEEHNYDGDIDANNLLRNGDASYADNTNFPSWVYNASISGFERTSGSSTVICSDYIKVQGDGVQNFDRYTIQAEHRQPTIDVAYSRYYFMIICYDKDKNFIENEHVTEYTTDARTVLSQPLNNGDTYVYLTANAGSWSTLGAGSYHYTQQFALFPTGHEYPDYTYSRIVGKYDSVDTGNSRLVLSTPWAGGTMATGTRIMNTRDGGTYSYIGASNQLMTNSWVTRSGTTSATESDSNMRAGSEYFRVGWLINRSAGNETSQIKNIKVWNIDDPTQSIGWTDKEFDLVDERGQSVMGNFQELQNIDTTDVSFEQREDGTIIIEGEINEVY